uniref:Ovule protein n=1 Tax=Romanomermis culicivorax TaxID=13658 RepID=A0A915HIR6_ROMCU
YCNCSFDPRLFILFASNCFRKQLNRVVFYLQANAPSNFVLSTFKQLSTIRCIIVAVPPHVPVLFAVTSHLV